MDGLEKGGVSFNADREIGWRQKKLNEIDAVWFYFKDDLHRLSQRTEFNKRMDEILTKKDEK